MKTLLVTGGAGFVGHHLVRALVARGDRVRILDDLSTGSVDGLPPDAEVVVSSIASTDGLERLVNGVDGIVHLAAIASVTACNDDWLGTHAVNQTGAIRILDAARRLGRVAVVYASSAAVYGDGHGRPANEAEVPLPRSAYGADKLATEHHARAAWAVHGVPTTGLRLFNVYGPGQPAASPYSGVIARFVARARSGLDLVVEGDGHQVRDFVHIDDAVAAFLLAIDTTAAGARVLNVCTGHATSVRTLARAALRTTGRTDTPRHAQPRPGDIRFSVGDPTLALAELGFRAQVGLDDGLANLMGTADG